MTLTQLEYFQASCKYNNLTRAAEALHVTQPTITNAIRALEEEYGVALFTRSNRRLELTETGQELLIRANRVLERATSLRAVSQRLARENTAIRVGLPPMAACTAFLKFIADYKKRYNCHQVFQLSRCPLSEAEKRLLDEDLDIAATAAPCPALSSIPLEEERILCLVSVNSPLARQARISPKELETEPLICFSGDDFLQECTQDYFCRQGIQATPFLITGELEVLHGAVADNCGIALLYESMVPLDRRIALRPLAPALSVPLSLSWKGGAMLDRRTMDFLTSLKNAIGKKEGIR